jgi:septal ring factor EnvC (AmiA/AmiB activator)
MSLTGIERQIEALSKQMAEAAAAEDFETAAALRNQIEELRGQTVRKPPPGQMGLGTHIPVAAPPKGWKPPKKPDPMTTNSKPRGRTR